mgnify:CR=1 FL=1
MDKTLKVNTKTKINTMLDAQRVVQELQKNFNLLVDRIVSPAEKELKETEGNTGEIQITQNNDGTYTFEVRTDNGWKTPVLGDSVVRFKDKPKTFSKSKKESIDEIESTDTSTGGKLAEKTIFDEKSNKFVMARPDFISDWYRVVSANFTHDAALWGIEHSLGVLPMMALVQLAPLQGSGNHGDVLAASDITWWTNLFSGLSHSHDSGTLFSNYGSIGQADGSVEEEDGYFRLYLWK